MSGAPRVAAVLKPSCAGAWPAQAELHRVCRQLGWPEPAVFFTTVAEPGASAARQALDEGADLVLAGGGDGTVREVAGVLAGTEVPLGILPLGTANLLARNLGLPLGRVEPMVRVALQGSERQVDIGTVRYVQQGPAGPVESPVQQFLALVGIGHDAATLADTSQDLKRWVGWPAYLAPGLRRLGSPPLRFRVEVDGGPRQELLAWSVLVGNCGRLPAGITVIPHAELDDGALDVVVVAPRTVLHWVPITLKGLLRRTRDVPGLAYQHGRTVRLFSEQPVTVQVDGDAHRDVLEIDVGVQERALRVRVPRPTGRARVR